MNLRIVLHLISYLLGLEGTAIVLSALVSYQMNDVPEQTVTLLLCGGAVTVVGIIGILLTRTHDKVHAGLREGFAIVSLGWLLISLCGALPFILASKRQWYDAIFETVSGFTTTGASVIDSKLRLWDGRLLENGIEGLSYGILFWRSMTHWIGGMGIVVFFLAILPVLGIGGQSLYNAEVPGVKTRSDQFTPRVASTAKIMFMVYLGLTFLQTLFLYFGGMTFFDAVCHSFSTISTGGFSTKNASIAAYESSYIQVVILFFMFLGSCNFILHYRALTGLPLREYLNEEIRIYCMILVGSILVITAYLFLSDLTDPLSKTAYHHAFWNSLLASAFQVVSISSTTGFSTANYAAWPTVAGVIILGLMFMGGCGGSTSGGIKCVRIILLSKFSISELRISIFPRALQNIRLNGERLEMPVLNRVLGFFMFYMLIAFIFTVLLSFFCQTDLLTLLSASISCISNVGPGFGDIAPDCSFGWMSVPAKLILALEMLIGRLELYTMLIFFLPSFWKK